MCPSLAQPRWHVGAFVSQLCGAFVSQLCGAFVSQLCGGYAACVSQLCRASPRDAAAVSLEGCSAVCQGTDCVLQQRSGSFTSTAGKGIDHRLCVTAEARHRLCVSR